MEFVRKIKMLSIAAAGLMLAAGIALILFPGIWARGACRLLGAAAVILGAVRICGSFSRDLYRLAYQFDLAAGILLILAGSFGVLRPDRALAAVPWAAGLLALVDGLFRIQTALEARRFGVPGWWRILLLAGCTAGLGTVLLARPSTSLLVLVRLCGVAVAVGSLQSIYVIYSTVRVIGSRGGRTLRDYQSWDEP